MKISTSKFIKYENNRLQIPKYENKHLKIPQVLK